jgi:hypothetical protein
MIDIVERIEAERAARAVDPMRPANPILADAKDEIVRLRAELDAARASAGTAEPVAYRWIDSPGVVRWTFGAYAPSTASHVDPLYTHPAPAIPASVREVLELFASDAAWRLGGSCDPNSGAFCGQSIAAAVLAALSTAPTREDEAGKLRIARDAIQFVIDGYARADVGHQDFRVEVYKVALDAAEKIDAPSVVASTERQP